VRKIRLILEFDGTAYVGWQVQANGPSVQQVVEEALEKVVGHPVRLTSSGRTDSGVHAKGMVAHFQTGKNLPGEAFREGVNRFLPSDIAVRDAREVAPGFHARFDAKGKWYRYRIWNDRIRSPLAGRFSWHVPASLDLGAMRAGADYVVGRHDFRAFRTAGCDAKTTVREVFSISIRNAGPMIVVDVRGEGFLRNMVRMLVGTLVEIGLNRREPGDVCRILNGEPDLRPGPTAPPQGLCLMEVWYD